jgi:uncharacterized membrane protein YfcA
MKLWFYTVSGLLFFSGLLWLLFHNFITPPDEFGVSHNVLEPRLLEIHGALAMVFLIVLGVLIPTHMHHPWHQRRNRMTSMFMVGGCLIMVLSGYGLYYFGGELLRPFVSKLHGIFGCLIPLILVWHVLAGRKKKAKPHKHKSSKSHHEIKSLSH